MPDFIGQNATMKMLERSLDFMAQRHQVLLANVANEETPRYKAKDLDFQSVLASIGKPGGASIPIAQTAAAPHPRHMLLAGQPDGLPPPTLGKFRHPRLGWTKIRCRSKRRWRPCMTTVRSTARRARF